MAIRIRELYDNQIITRINQDRVVKQILICLTFVISFAILEYYIFEGYFNTFQQKPIFLNIYPYHLYFVLPTFFVVSFILGHDPRLFKCFRLGSVLRTSANMWVLLLSIMVLEDMLYFLVAGHAIRAQNWTCSHLGCSNFGFTEIPNWYFGAFLLALCVWAIDNMILTKKNLKYLDKFSIIKILF